MNATPFTAMGWIVGLTDCWIGGSLDCRIVGLLDCWIVGLSDCRIVMGPILRPCRRCFAAFLAQSLLNKSRARTRQARAR